MQSNKLNQFNGYFTCRRTYIQAIADIIPTFNQWEVFPGSAQTDVEVVVVVSTACCEQSTPINGCQTENACKNNISLQSLSSEDGQNMK